MSRQWKRNVEVLVGKEGSGLLVNRLRIQFDITKTVDEIPNSAVIKIFNLNYENEELVNEVYEDIIVKAGYLDSEKIIFTGTIKYVYKYRDGTDTIIEIEAGDGDQDYKVSTINETIAAGTTDEDAIEKAVKTFKKTTKGVVQVGKKARRRGKVLTGSTKTILREISARNNANWSIQDGQLVIVEADKVLPDEAIVINSATGMIGIPEINDRGIAVKCLLNPELKINCAIKLNNNSIKAKRTRPQSLAVPREKEEAVQKKPVERDADGLYKVIRISHKGDNRGGDFISEIECIGISEPIPKSRS